MSLFASLFGSIRDAMVLTERMNMVGEKAEKALAMSLESRERIVRLETILDLAMRAEQKRLPRD
jgi:hypothetical protein